MNRVARIIHLEYAHKRHILGQEIGVVVMDTGICQHVDFSSPTQRILVFKDFVAGKTRMYDDNGHGVHVAGIVAGNGMASGGKYIGVAPRCNLIILKVLNEKGNGEIEDVLRALDWVIENKERYNIRIVNISVGTAKKELIDENSVLIQGVNEVWDHGIVVVAAAGNNGPTPKSIGAPGISRKVITVGASDDNVPIVMGNYAKKDYSGRGPTKSCIKKPDIVAPGSRIISCNAMENASTFNGRKPYTMKSGTSMATPVVSGAVALLLSKYPDMTNLEVKIRLKNSAKDLGFPHERQGWGLLDIERMLKV